MFSSSLSRSSKQLWATASRRATVLPSYSNNSQPRLSPRVFLDSRTSRVCYSTTPALFKKYESHHDHANVKNPTGSSKGLAGVHADDQEDEVEKEQNLLSNDDDLMVGNEGLEEIDPKDFPELYPSESEDIEGLSQESHPDNERDFENNSSYRTDDTIIKDKESRTASVLLSDKERSEEEFSWFVDESYPDRAAGDQHPAESTSASTSDFIPLWQKNAQLSPVGDAIDGENQELEQHSADSIASLVKLIESERAKNVKVIDMRDKCDWTEWMVIAEGLSERHLGNVADQVYSALKKSSPRTSPPVMEGRDTSDWVVIDAGSVVIHFMTPEARKERDLEGLWASVKNPLKLKDAEDISWEDVKGKMTKSWKESTGRSRGEDGKRGRRGERDIPLSEVVKW